MNQGLLHTNTSVTLPIHFHHDVQFISTVLYRPLTLNELLKYTLNKI